MVLSRAKRTPTTSIRFRNKLNIYIHYMEAYRSGHNGPHSKCGYRPKRYKGSNPFASASSAHPSKVAQPNKRLDKDSHAFFLLVALPDGIRCTSTASGRRNDVAFRFTTLTAERLVGRIPSLPPNKRLPYNGQSFILRRDEIRTHFCDSKMRSRTNAKR